MKIMFQCFAKVFTSYLDFEDEIDVDSSDMTVGEPCSTLEEALEKAESYSLEAVYDMLNHPEHVESLFVRPVVVDGGEDVIIFTNREEHSDIAECYDMHESDGAG